MGFTDPAMACRRLCPREEGQDCTGTPGLVTVIEVIGRRIVEVGCLLDETQTKIARVKMEVLVRISGDCRHVMNAGHVVSPHCCANAHGSSEPIPAMTSAGIASSRRQLAGL